MSLTSLCPLNMCTFCPLFFFFNDTATTEIYTLSLHDALPIYATRGKVMALPRGPSSEPAVRAPRPPAAPSPARSEEHTSELQSPCNLVCRLLLEKKKKINSWSARWHGRWSLTVP